MGQTFVIVGAGQGGVAAADELRDQGFDGRIVLIGDEAELPYERPPLSKEYLAGDSSDDDLYIYPKKWYEENNIELALGVAACRVDVGSSRVELGNGSSIGYNRLLLATGGQPRKLPGLPADGVFYLRTHGDARQLSAQLQRGKKVVIIGAGFIGCEVAATARERGVEVTILESQRAPLERVIGPELGQVVAELHRERDVELRTDDSVEAVTRTGCGLLVRGSRGSPIECDAVIVGVGIEPNVEPVRGTGVQLDDGILVDQYCQTTVAGIFAAGDMSRHYHPVFGRHVRVEHYDNALRQGAAAAENMLGRRRVFDDPHWFWSDQYAHNLQSLGIASCWDEILLSGSTSDRSFCALYLKDRQVQSVLALNRPKAIMVARRLGYIGARIEDIQASEELADLRKRW